MTEIRINAFMTAHTAVVEELNTQYPCCDALEVCDELTKDMLKNCNSFEELYGVINRGIVHTGRDEEWLECLDRYNQALEHMWKLYIEIGA
jgi:hypothetical protein